MERNMYTYIDNYGDENPVSLKLNMYRDNGNLFVGLEEYDEDLEDWDSYCNVTKNIVELPYLESAINMDYGGQEKIKFLTDNGFGVLTDKTVREGGVVYPVFRFDMDKLKEIDPEFFVKYAKEHGCQLDVVAFTESFVDKEYDTTTYYFKAPKELLEKRSSEVECLEISVEFPTEQAEARYASVQLSATDSKMGRDWFDVDMPYEKIEKLMNMAEKELAKKELVALDQRISEAKEVGRFQENGDGTRKGKEFER